MSLYLGTSKIDQLYLGTSKIKEIYLGTDKIYTGDIWDYYEQGEINGITWLANPLTRSGYYGSASSIKNSTSLEMDVNSGSSTYYWNTHFATSEAIHIPSDATTLKAKVYTQTNGYGFSDSGSVKIGIILGTATAASNIITIASSSCTDTSHAGYANAITLSGDVSSYAGSDLYKLAIYGNQRQNASNKRKVYIGKVWFE